MREISYALVVEAPEGQTTHYLLSSERITVGRGDTNSLVLNEETVSTSHCEFRRAGNRYDLVDLQSKNGTKINDEEIGSKGQPLRDGDALLIGLTVKALFVEITAIGAKDAAPSGQRDTKTRKLERPRTASQPTINPVAAAMAKAAKKG